MPPNIALVRTVQRLSVRVRGYLPPHNFTVKLHSSVGLFLLPTLAEARSLFKGGVSEDGK
ncbi:MULTISPECIES: hypothetical protein [unclassified Coleofasciculus]|uniref:hypothetical protein n=1 Tax=unclassified Coleofasciculus TaxID=2692782 RepID=UPI001882BD50|nr:MULTISPECIES: hypothetical protein [unclassified Coleofasciculus]MBE9127925.1 hypothetical protein [Coleofasciculus sp. LEGE 07081]MBE9150637.1 hypothetical protein [Coleofasciculus sp. LEGE 07092]